MSHNLTKTLVCFNRNLRMKKDMETLDTIVQSHLNAWVDVYSETIYRNDKSSNDIKTRSDFIHIHNNQFLCCNV